MCHAHGLSPPALRSNTPYQSLTIVPGPQTASLHCTVPLHLLPHNRYCFCLFEWRLDHESILSHKGWECSVEWAQLPTRSFHFLRISAALILGDRLRPSRPPAEIQVRAEMLQLLRTDSAQRYAVHLIGLPIRSVSVDETTSTRQPTFNIHGPSLKRQKDKFRLRLYKHDLGSGLAGLLFWSSQPRIPNLDDRFPNACPVYCQV